MKLIDKLKNVFFEEVEDDEEEIPQTFAKKVEVPHKRPVHHFEEDGEKEETKEIKIEKQKEENNLDIGIKPRDLIREETQKEKVFPMMYDVDDFLEDKDVPKEVAVAPVEEEHEPASMRREREDYGEEKELYHGKKELSYVESISKPSYSYTKTYYEEKETKGFKPSPIISPIYGILDKNYKKEEVITKHETRIVSSYKKPDLDSVRKKAFGNDDNSSDKFVKAPIEEEAEKKVYDVHSNKPQVNRVTLADADEYYNDLGLAYNVDYSDASRNTTQTRTAKYNNQNKKKEEKDDDNLFDLIDSMYNKED